MVAALVLGREYALIVADDIILQLAHGLKLHACHLTESIGSFSQCMFRRRLQRMTVLVEERAEQSHRGNLCKRIEKGRPITWQHIEVAGTGLYEREQTAAIHALATSKDGIQITEVVDDEIQRLQPSVARRIHEVHHADVVLHDVVNNVSLGKFFGRLSEECHNRISIQNQVFVIHISNYVYIIIFISS